MERLGSFGFDDYRVLHTILQDPADDIISRASRRIGRFIQLDGKRMLKYGLKAARRAPQFSKR